MYILVLQSNNHKIVIFVICSYESRNPLKLNSYLNVSGYPYTMQQTSAKKQWNPPRRTYTWQAEDLLISINTTSLGLYTPTCTRLVPPLTWLSSKDSKSKVKVSQTSGSAVQSKPKITQKNVEIDPNDEQGYYSWPSSVTNAFLEVDSRSEDVIANIALDKDVASLNPPLSRGNIGKTSESVVDADRYKFKEDVSPSRTIEILVGRALVENSLSTLRMNGFSREDIFRMLDKGPWILAFNIVRVLPKLYSDIQVRR